MNAADQSRFPRRPARHFRGPWVEPREVVVVGWRQGAFRRHGFYLEWSHVPILRRAAGTGHFSHLLFLEDDMRFTDRHLRYWCRYRKPLAEVGLLPGFVRFEWFDDKQYLVDVQTPLDPASRRRVIATDGRELCGHVVNLDNPHQALYILDCALSNEHFRFSRSRSSLRSRVIRWGILERATAGPIFDHVPAGLVSRNVVPVRMDGDSQRLDPCCLIEHMAGNYSRNPDSPFGVLTVDDLFAEASSTPDGARR